MAAAAAAQIKAGIARTRRDQATGSRLRARALGLEAAYTYCLLTGRPARISRIPYGHKGVPGTPTGPLIRFLHEFYHCVRTRLAALDGNRDIADMEVLNPKPETLVGWIRALNPKHEIFEAWMEACNLYWAQKEIELASADRQRNRGSATIFSLTAIESS